MKLTLVLEFKSRQSRAELGPFRRLSLEPTAVTHGGAVIARLRRDGCWKLANGVEYLEITIHGSEHQIMTVQLTDRDEVRVTGPYSVLFLSDSGLATEPGDIPLAVPEPEARAWRAVADDKAFETIEIIADS
jgi:hypothetical protein